MISKRHGFSAAGGMYIDNDTADVTSAGRSFQIREPTTWKARLAIDDSLRVGKILHNYTYQVDARSKRFCKEEAGLGVDLSLPACGGSTYWKLVNGKIS